MNQINHMQKDTLGIWADNFFPAWVKPNHLSFIRIFSSLAMLVLELTDLSLGLIIILGLVSGFSDLLDGALARQRGQVTKLGAFLDPLGDKIFAFILAFILWHRGWVNVYLLLSLLLTELHTVGIPLLVVIQRKTAGKSLFPPPAVKPNRLGKYKTFCLAFGLGFVIIANWLGFVPLEMFSTFAIYLGLILGLAAEVQYFKDWHEGMWT
jgi:phosphatidylglycerophosphate synthase